MKALSLKLSHPLKPSLARRLRQLLVLLVAGTTVTFVNAQTPEPRPLEDVDSLMPPLTNPSDGVRVIPQAQAAAAKTLPHGGEAEPSIPTEFSAYREKDAQLTLEAIRQTGGVVEPAEFARMRHFLDNRYNGVTVVKTLRAGARTFDCIPLYQQPALRDGSVVAIPPGDKDDKTSGRSGESSSEASCSEGTVPLERISIADMARYPTLRSFLGENHDRPAVSRSDEILQPSSSTQSASASSGFSTQPHFWQNLRTVPTAITGNGATLNVWNPTTNDFTLEQTWLYGYDSSNAVQSVEVGWQKFNGGMPYLFAGSFVGGNYTAAQYSADFVQVSTKTFPGTSFTASQISAAGGTQKTLWVEWQWNAAGSAWWLWVNDSWIGYFKGSRFGSGPLSIAAMSAQMASGSDNGALHFDVGGEIQNPATGTPSVPMGSGQFASAGYRQAAFAADIYYYDSNIVQQYTDLTKATIVVDNPSCYTMALAGVEPSQFPSPLPKGASTTGLNPQMNRNGIYFGGPGCS